MTSAPTPGDAGAGVPAGLPRRRLLQGAAGGALAGALVGAGAMQAAGAVGGAADGSDATGGADRETVDLTQSYSLYDQPHPRGIATAPQRHAIFMTFDMNDGTTASDLQVLLARWTAAASRLMAGQAIGQIQPSHVEAIGQDTGEAAGLEPSSLTITLGLGPSLFDARFGLAAKKPTLLAELPALPSDNLDAGSSGGDLSLQICSDDPQVSYHAVRNLARMARDTVQTRWTVIGFGRASAGTGQQTPRNLFGFKDGTRNITTDADRDSFVWLTDAGWMSGGSYQVVRKIEMNIETWDADRISDQERIFGRRKLGGAPLSGRKEFDTPDFTAVDAQKQPLINPASHVALASPENNDGVKILRRSYNYTDGINQFGQLDAGLLFIAYMNDPQHFVRLQTRLGRSDLMNEYTSHVGSAIFAVPPTPKTGHYIGEELFS